MKIVFVDTAVSGHHLPYIKALAALPDSACAILPQAVEALQIPQRVCKFPAGKNRRFRDSWKWLLAVKKIADSEQPDVVHFLMGDDFYRFFGAGLFLFSRYKVVVTLHWTRSSLAGRLSTKCIAVQSDSVVVHSAYLQKKLLSWGIRNAKHIEYPQFGTHDYPMEEARAAWQLDLTTPVITSLGSTRHDKGLDILLEALAKVRKPFQLLIAGEPSYFGEDFIQEKIRPYRDGVRLHLKYLSDEELAQAVCASDIIALPYRKKFDGASGPLGDGVVHSKLIVGSNHGNLGSTIRENHLGYTFETENPESLAEVLEQALDRKWKPDETYLAYRKLLSPERFQGEYTRLYRELTHCLGGEQ